MAGAGSARAHFGRERLEGYEAAVATGHKGADLLDIPDPVGSGDQTTVGVVHLGDSGSPGR
jgi:hypothetical protein